jgi:hypothetical protein
MLLFLENLRGWRSTITDCLMTVQYQPRMICVWAGASHSKVVAWGLTTHFTFILQTRHFLLFISIEKKCQPIYSRPEIVNPPCILSRTPVGALILGFSTRQQPSSHRRSQGYLQTVIPANRASHFLWALAMEPGMSQSGPYLRVDRAKAQKTYLGRKLSPWIAQRRVTMKARREHFLHRLGWWSSTHVLKVSIPHLSPGPYCDGERLGEKPETYLNKGQIYYLRIIDTAPPTPDSGKTTYRTFVSVSLKEQDQQMNAEAYWRLWEVRRALHKLDKTDHERGYAETLGRTYRRVPQWLFCDLDNRFIG